MTGCEDCTTECKLKEVILSGFLRSILYILDDCIHRIHISHSGFPLLTFTFVIELMARLCIYIYKNINIADCNQGPPK